MDLTFTIHYNDPVLLLIKLHLTATECHLSYRITHLSPDTSKHTPP